MNILAELDARADAAGEHAFVMRVAAMDIRALRMRVADADAAYAKLFALCEAQLPEKYRTEKDAA